MNPFFLLGGGAVLGQASTLVTSPLSTWLSQWTMPYTLHTGRQITYDANRQYPNVLPPAETIIDLYWRGYVNKNVLNETLKRNGIDVENTDRLLATSFLCNTGWKAAVNAARPKLSNEMIFALAGLGLFDYGDVERELRNTGAYSFALRKTIIDKQWAPDVATAMSQYAMDTISGEEYNRFFALNGVWRPIDKTLLESMTSPIASSDAIEMLLRHVMGLSDSRSMLQASGFRNDRHKDLLLDLAKARLTPSMSQLTEMYRTGAVAAVTHDKLGLYADYPAWLEEMSERLGLGDDDVKLFDSLGNQGNISWAKLMYGASRPQLSVQQAFQAFARFRIGRTQKYTDAGIPVTPFSSADLQDQLAVNGYPAGMQNYVAALQYRQPRLFDIRRQVQFGMVSDAAAVNLFQDLGYTPTDSVTQVEIAKEIQRRKDTAYVQSTVNAAGKSLTDSTVEGYTQGLITFEQATIQLGELGFDVSQSTIVLNAALAKWLHESVKMSIAAVEKGYMGGALSTADAGQALTAIGLTQTGVANYLSRWNLQRTLPHRAESAGTVVRWHREGILSAAQAAERLANLGYNQPDSLLLVAEAEKVANDQAAKAATTQLRNKAAQAKALAAIQKGHISEANAIAKQLKQLTPRPTLKRWLKKGLISEAYFIDRMSVMGYPDDIILLDIEDATGPKLGGKLSTNGQTAPPS